MTDTPQIELIGIDKHYGSYHALRDINLTIPKGAFVALVGPSGCGKSTLLRSLAGLEAISGGTMKIAGREINNVPPRKRDIAMVFQSYALYPHMRVAQNLTYSMRLKGAAKPEAAKAAEGVARTTGLTGLLDRFPRQLSGGQRQRVAMGRAIIRDPKAFLFDEPLSNLDAALRVHMRKEIRALHDRLGATSVYVTHDQIEAMTMADHVVVLRDGVVEQQGAPLAIYDRPDNRFVAGFIGSPAMNFIDAQVSADGKTLELKTPKSDRLPLARAMDPGRQVTVGLRPEHLFLTTPDMAKITLPVDSTESTGSTTYLSCADPELVVVVHDRLSINIGELMHLGIETTNIHMFDAETGQAIR